LALVRLVRKPSYLESEGALNIPLLSRESDSGFLSLIVVEGLFRLSNSNLAKD
jgi:hypothetical protein